VGNGVIMSNNATLAGHITVEDRAILGGLSAIHQFCRVGRHAFVGGCSAVARDVPPYTIVYGNRAKMVGLNLVGLKRSGVGDTALQVLKQAYELLFLSEHNLKEGLSRVRRDLPQTPEIQNLLQFIDTTERGLVPVDVRENRSHRG
jgi:UDP-N-acetylglucosamine acyltransferase